MGLAISFIYAFLSLFHRVSEHRNRPFYFLSVTRLLCWVLLIAGIEIVADPSFYKNLIQVSFVLNIVAESCNLIRKQETAATATFYTFVLASGSRSVALWSLIFSDISNGLEMSIPAFVISVSILAWFFLYPTFKERHNALLLYTITFFLQTWATLDLAIHHNDFAHSLLLVATLGYLMTFARYYLNAFVEKNSSVNLHWAYFIANAIMALSTLLITGEHNHD
ncbi:hypothetical protein RCJ22_09555 [Vibrio sp. FNV 38]|nr:hypothetical protein [Vibrio sp. FNV 38]